MRPLKAAVAALLTLALAATPAAAITNGVPDDGEHPYVGQLIFYVPDAVPSPYPVPGGWFSCSGTLVSPTVVVTAGHCTFAIGTDSVSTTTEDNRTTAEDGNGSGGNDVWFSVNEDDDHWDGWPETFDTDGNLNFPTQAARYEARSSFLQGNNLWIRATSFPHPEYDDLAFFHHDAGVIVLDEAVDVDGYGEIAGLRYLDRYLSTPRNSHRFEVVGYGLEKSGPFTAEGGDTRLKASPKLNTLKSDPKNTFMLLSNNTRTGGTCFGDSGGPTFDDTDSNLLVAVTSFGFSSTCTGVGGVYRIDQPDDQAFLATFMDD
jgi:hypothetical protein